MQIILLKYIYLINFVSLHSCKHWTMTIHDTSLLISWSFPPGTTRLQYVPSCLSTFSPRHTQCTSIFFPPSRCKFLVRRAHSFSASSSNTGSASQMPRTGAGDERVRVSGQGDARDGPPSFLCQNKTCELTRIEHELCKF